MARHRSTQVKSNTHDVKTCAAAGAGGFDEFANVVGCFDDRALNHDGKRLRIILLSPSCRKASNG